MGKTLILGDMMLDRMVTGSEVRLSREAVAPMVEVASVTSSPGGAGNFACNFKAMGGAVDLIAPIGADEAGNELTKLLQDQFGGHAYLLRMGEPFKTLVRTRICVGGNQLLRMDNTTPQCCDHTYAPSLTNYRMVVTPPAYLDRIVITDYRTGAITPLVLHTLAQLYPNVPIIVDTTAERLVMFGNTSMVKLNLPEFWKAAESCVDPAMSSQDEEERIYVGARHICKQMQLGSLLITAGERGAYLFDKKILHKSAGLKTFVADTVGAGDTFLAAFLNSDLSRITEALMHANIAASLAIQQRGPAVITRDAWQDEIVRRTSPESKIMSRAEAAEFVARKQRQGKCVVFTNGVFDLLHPGHIMFLEFCKSQGDILVVGCNSQTSARLCKGEGRPIISEEWRKTCLALNHSVDAVVTFDEPSACELLKALKPNVYAKGYDYQTTILPEMDIVASNGGRVVFGQEFKLHSSEILGLTQAE